MNKRKLSIFIILMILSSFGITYADNNNYPYNPTFEIKENLSEYEVYDQELNKNATELYQKILTLSVDSNYDPVEESEENKFHSTSIDHHTCFRGGTNHDECYEVPLDMECGCFYREIYCCCEKRMYREVLLCPTHKI